MNPLWPHGHKQAPIPRLSGDIEYKAHHVLWTVEVLIEIAEPVQLVKTLVKTY